MQKDRTKSLMKQREDHENIAMISDFFSPESRERHLRLALRFLAEAQSD